MQATEQKHPVKEESRHVLELDTNTAPDITCAEDIINAFPFTLAPNF